MAFDDQTRRRLFKTVTACRNLLTEDFDDQLRGRFGIYADERRVLEIDRLPGLDDAGREVAGLLRERIDHLAAGKGRQALGEAVHRLRREQAFTVLNRFAAVRMAEERDLISQSVGGGFQSRGFRVFEQAAGGTALGELYDRYRIYLDCLFDELSLDLGVLFDRSDAMGLLFPGEQALRALFDELNHPDIAPLWAEDETIGWIYQYYNDPEERKRMRKESAAPRNSRELAVRNQFFTPRYVVEFLTDNTLGRIWYEMTKGETRLKEQCRYLVRRPVEIFLPGPDVNFWHDADGTEAFREFCGSADVNKLPEDPALGVLLGWVGSLKTLGFEEELRLIGLTHQEVMDRYLLPLEKRETPAGVPEAHSIVLLQILWRLAYEAGKHGYGDLRAAASVDPIAGPTWEALRHRLSNPMEGLSQEEILKLPVFIPHRPIKDPREIRLLDPACGSMHFGLYAFDIYETIYEEAWQLGLLDASEFGGDIPPFPHGSIRKRIVERVHSNDTHEDIDSVSARVVILNQSDMGDGLFHAGPYIAPPTRNYRPGVAREIALVDFDYRHALATGWLTHGEGERLVRETDAFEHTRLDPLAPNEIYERFCRDVPRLIIEHNIHGVDIDPRAVQIAALSLWLRAQKAWKDQGVRAAERPQVRRSNIVCAEPMPGSAEMLEEFVATLDPPLLGDLVKTAFEKMQLAGEAGSLLKIEEEIRTAIDTARKECLKQQDDLLSRKDRSQEEFFDTAEQQVIDALRNYAERADADSYQRRLFADDAARGFAFIHVCRQRYDVALMNPPFGDASLPSKPYIEENYGDTKGDVYKAFVECFHARLVPAGYLGIISSRTGFFLGQSEDWRTRVVLRLFRPIALADLGSGVLDAMVEVAAYVLRSLSVAEAHDLTRSIVPALGKVVRDSQDRFSLPKWQAARGGLKRHQALAELEHLEAHGFVQRSPGEIVRYTPLWHSVTKVSVPAEPVYPPLVCVKALGVEDKQRAISEAIFHRSNSRKFVSDPKSFRAIPTSPFAYWATPAVRNIFQTLSAIEGEGREIRVGGQTGDDFRYLRLFWETEGCSKPSNWTPFQKGGRYSPFYSDASLVVDWDKSRKTFRGFAGRIGRANQHPSSFEYYFRPGLTWPIKNRFSFKPWPMPAGCVFAHVGAAAFFDSDVEAFWAVMSSSVFTQLIQMTAGWNFEVGVIQQTPVPPIDREASLALGSLAQRAWALKRKSDSSNAASHAFELPALLAATGCTLSERAADWATRVYTSEEAVAAIQSEIDDLAFRLYDLDASDRAALTSTIATEAIGDAEAEDNEEDVATADAPALAADLLAYAVGCTFGRWDIRFATGERQSPELPDPFDPLPVCPPGMLQNAQGLPAQPKDVPNDYPLRSIPWSGILVDDENHPDDIVGRVRGSLQAIWGDRADDIEAEACEILGVKAKPKENLDALRVYFRDPNRFFKDHLARYSKSRRKAPIYWPLSTESGSYTLWIYYQRLDSQTLYTCVSDFIDPKREAVGRTAEDLARRIGAGGSSEERQRLEDLTTFQAELKTLRDRLLEVAALPYRPNLNDGVQITAAPLWQCFRHSPWQRVLKDTWKELEKGKYDWAHLALPIWPARVVAQCAKDRSLAIAHGLEDLLWVPDVSGKKKDQLRPLKDPEDEIKELIKGGFDKKDVDRAAGDVDAAQTLGIRDNLWIERHSGAWRRRLSPKEEIENETKLRKGI